MLRDHVKFYLKDQNSKSTTPINARVQINGKSFKYGIGYSIHPDLWDLQLQRPTKDKSKFKSWTNLEPGIKAVVDNINARQDNVTNLIVAFVNLKEQRRESFTKEDLKSYLDTELGLSKISNGPKNLLLPYFSDFIERMESKKIFKDDKTYYAKGTIKTYKVSNKKFQEYEENRKVKLCFDDINNDFYDDFLIFCYSLNLTNNYIGNHVKHLKVVMEQARQEGLHNNLTYRDKHFKVMDEVSDSIYLTYEEINSIKALDLTRTPKLEKTRDIFLICFYTGARISDVQNIDQKSFYEDEGKMYLKILVKKSNFQNSVSVPVRSELKQILEKYGYVVPKYAEQKVNANLKEIGKKAGLTQILRVTEKRAGQSKIKELPKYQLITTHSARRSAASNMFKDGTPTSIIMKLTGHKTEKSFLKYIKVKEEESAKLLANTKFFNESI